MNRNLLSSIFLTIVLLGILGCKSGDGDKGDQSLTEKNDPPTIDYSFIVMGCNRIGWSDDEQKPDKSHEEVWRNSEYYNDAHTNLNQLNATWNDVMNLAHRPDYFFFAGDMVLAENKDPEVLKAQLTAWVKLYDDHPIAGSGIRMVAIPGNHEFLYSLYPEPGELPLKEANDIWLNTMQKFIAGSNGPGKGGPDSLKQDESRLTYSIDHQGDHFVLMNTDTYDSVGFTPVEWIAGDMRKWRKNNPSGHLFLLGHKPAYVEGGGTDMATGVGEALWSVMKETKAEAMLSAHEHLFWAGRPVSGQSSWQIVAGNGGTTLQNQEGDPGHFFGFTEVQVMSDGTVMAISHGREEPDPDWAPVVGTTTPRDTFDLTWK